MNANPEPIPFKQDWQDPEARYLRPETPKPPAIPVEKVLGAKWALWIRQAAQGKAAPPDYIAVALISVAGALIGNTRWVSPWDGWAEPPIIWAMVIGAPSMNKSLGLDAILAPLKRMERDAWAEGEFGRIYEYFLTQFADQKAHDNGEFFTPVSIVETIVNVIEPTPGKVIDPACGSGGIFVQSAHFVEMQKANPNERLTFYGMEKNPTTIRLAKINLAVHGLEGDVQKAISYSEDPHKDKGPLAM